MRTGGPSPRRKRRRRRSGQRFRPERPRARFAVRDALLVVATAAAAYLVLTGVVFPLLFP